MAADFVALLTNEPDPVLHVHFNTRGNYHVPPVVLWVHVNRHKTLCYRQNVCKAVTSLLFERVVVADRLMHGLHPQSKGYRPGEYCRRFFGDSRTNGAHANPHEVTERLPVYYGAGKSIAACSSVQSCAAHGTPNARRNCLSAFIAV